MIGVDWEELNDYAEKEKRSVIKMLLTDLRHDDLELARDTVYALYKANIRWSELKVIENSIDYELAQQELTAFDDQN